MKAIEKRVQELEAERLYETRPPLHIVEYVVRYGDDVEAKQAEAEAEFNRVNPVGVIFKPRPSRCASMRQEIAPLLSELIDAPLAILGS